MSTSRSQSKSSKSSSTHVTPAASHADASAQRIADATATTTPAVVSPIKLPPAGADIPSPPAGFVATNATDYRGLLPKKTELAVLPDAVTELKGFTNFTEVFGKTAPSLTTVTEALDAAAQWSTMRNKSSAWDLFCQTQEGLSWKIARGYIAKLKPAFALATSLDNTVAAQNPSLNALFGVGSEIAKRAVTSRAANKKAKAEGKPPTHGKVNKKAAKLAAEVAEAAAKATPAPAAAVAPAGLAVNPAPNGAGH
jgi:hypothetical protein